MDKEICKCGNSTFYFKGKKKICSKCGETISVQEIKKKCKIVGCDNVAWDYGEGYCRNHFEEVEEERYRDAKNEAKEKAEKKGEEFDEREFRESYKENKEKDIKPKDVDKLNKTLF